MLQPNLANLAPSNSSHQNTTNVVEGQLGARFHVTKYPTLKMFRFGSVVKREYRGQRSVTALTNFIRTQLVVPVTRLTTPDDIYSIDVSRVVWSMQLYVSSSVCSMLSVNFIGA